MDGVLVDFETGVVAKMNSELSKENPKEPKLAAKVIAELGRNYVTVDDIGKYSPGKSKASVSYMYALVHDDEEFWANLPWNKGGKQLWARIRHHSKWDYALDEDGQPNVLIDDFSTKIDPWNERGGVGILHTSAENTIKILDTLEDL